MRRKLRRARVLDVGFDVWTNPEDASARRGSLDVRVVHCAAQVEIFWWLEECNDS